MLKVYSVISIVSAIAVALAFASYFYSVAEIVSNTCGSGLVIYTKTHRGFPLPWFLTESRSFSGNADCIIHVTPAWVSLCCYHALDILNFALDAGSYVLVGSVVALFTTRARYGWQFRTRLSGVSKDHLGVGEASAIAFFTLGLLFLFLGVFGYILAAWLDVPTPQQTALFEWYTIAGVGLLVPTVFFAILEPLKGIENTAADS